MKQSRLVLAFLLAAEVVAATAVVSVLVAGCASVQALEPPHPVAVPMPPEVAERFDYEARPVEARKAWSPTARPT